MKGKGRGSEEEGMGGRFGGGQRTEGERGFGNTGMWGWGRALGMRGQGYGDGDMGTGVWGQGYRDGDMGTGVWGQGYGDRDMGTGI